MESDILIDKSTQDSRLRCALALIERGENFFNAGNLYKAYEAFTLGTELYPEYARAKKNLGILFWKRGDIELAYKYLSEALNLDPDDPSIVLSYGNFFESTSRIYLAQGLYEIYLTKKYDLQIAKALTRLKQNCQQKNLGNTNQIRKPIKKQIVFISDMSPYIARVPKFAYGLKQAGWDVVLLHKNELTFSPEKYFIETRQYQTPKEAADLAATYCPLSYHVFSAWSFNTAAAVIQRSPGKIVFDDYDVMAGMVKESFARNAYPGQLELERFCLESADGLCCRHIATQYAKRHLKYHYKGKKILLVDSCWATHLTSGKSKRQDGTSDFHIVYCGNLSQGICKTDYIFQLIETLASKQIHFHIYPATGIPDAVLANYNKLEHFAPFFHLHHSIQPNKLSEEISQYDVGWFDIRAFPDSFHVYNKWLFTYYAGTNKIFDYIDAGLPIIINASRFIETLLKRAGVLIKINDDFDNDPRKFLSQVDWKSLKKNAIKARSRYAVSNQAQRLGAFYNTI